MIFQDPYASLNPRKTVLQIVGESLRRHDNIRGLELEQRVTELLGQVGLRPEYIRRYPHAFSGGERQRIGVARALALHPRLVIADEAVSALDVSVQAQILNLLQELQTEFDLTYLFVAHDLSVVDYISDRVAVMYVGKLVEVGSRERIFAKPRHPYTEALLSAVPKPDPRLRSSGARIPASPAAGTWPMSSGQSSFLRGRAFAGPLPGGQTNSRSNSGATASLCPAVTGADQSECFGGASPPTADDRAAPCARLSTVLFFVRSPPRLVFFSSNPLVGSPDRPPAAGFTDSGSPRFENEAAWRVPVLCVEAVEAAAVTRESSHAMR